MPYLKYTFMKMLFLFTQIHSTQRISLSFNIIPSPNNDYDQLQTHGSEKSEMPDIYYEYEYIISTYPHVYYDCYIKLISEALTTNCSLHIGSSLQTFYQNIFDEIYTKICNSIIDCAQKKTEIYDFTNEKRAQLGMKLKSTKIAEVLSYDEFDIRITDNKMIFHVLNKLINKLIYKGLIVLLGCVKSIESICRVPLVSNFITSHGSKQDAVLKNCQVFQRNLTPKALANFNIDNIILNSLTQDNTEKIFVLEFDLSSFIMHQLIDLIFVTQVDDELISDLFLDKNMCTKQISEKLDYLLVCFDNFLLRLNLITQSKNCQIESCKIIFESSTIIHYLKYGYNLNQKNFNLFLELLQKVPEKIKEWINTILAKMAIPNLHCELSNITNTRIVYRFLISNPDYYTCYQALFESLCLLNAEYENMCNSIAKITYGVVTISGSKEILVFPYISIQNLIAQAETLQNNLQNSVCIQGVDEIAIFNKYSTKAKQAVIQSYLCAQKCLLIYKTLQVTFFNFNHCYENLLETNSAINSELNNLVLIFKVYKEGIDDKMIHFKKEITKVRFQNVRRATN